MTLYPIADALAGPFHLANALIGGVRQVKTRPMDKGANPAARSDIAEAIGAAFDWWRDAGVDMDFADAPIDWLAKDEPVAELPAILRPREDAPKPRGASDETPAAPAIGRAALPADLPAFQEWWMSEPLLDAGRVANRLPPRGSAGAALMVIVAEPEENDTERLLDGPQGRLLAGALAALGIAEDAVYLASALPRHTPMADWEEAQARGMGEALRHHVALVAPQRLLVLGTSIPPLLGNDLTQNPAGSREFNHEGSSIPMLVARGLPALLERPRWKAALWQGLLDWTV